MYICGSPQRRITLGILYGYKMLPQIMALIFALSIRKIKIKGLDDAKYMAFAVYITSIVTAVVIVITYTLHIFINVFAVIFSLGFFIGTTSILFLVLMPPVSCLPRQYDIRVVEGEVDRYIYQDLIIKFA